ncbi:MAG: TetR/AcrR family transcriptional regulator [Chitinophagales bacterium]|nr:TetR/AcrR family transcriptional regulator [Chitinophagaceae bacterium]MCB9064682.1 TetR/AcrR family transcriptional regulator [Chitinophagales bacterium]
MTNRSVEKSMSPRTKEQLEELKKKRRVTILTAALKVFSESGYRGATVNMIALEAGVSKGLLYTYFESKEALLENLLSYGLSQVDKYKAFIPEKGISTKEDFGTVLKEIVGFYTKENDFWRLYISVILQQDVSEKFVKMTQGFIEEYLSIFVAYFQKKKVDNPMAEALLLGSMLDGIMFGMVMAPGMYPLDDIIQLMIKKFG